MEYALSKKEGSEDPQQRTANQLTSTEAPTKGKKRSGNEITVAQTTTHQQQKPNRVKKNKRGPLAEPPASKTGPPKKSELACNDPGETNPWPEPSHPPLRQRNCWGIIKPNAPTAHIRAKTTVRTRRDGKKRLVKLLSTKALLKSTPHMRGRMKPGPLVRPKSIHPGRNKISPGETVYTHHQQQQKPRRQAQQARKPQQS